VLPAPLMPGSGACASVSETPAASV
jgi:hypothetical protein